MARAITLPPDRPVSDQATPPPQASPKNRNPRQPGQTRDQTRKMCIGPWRVERELGRGGMATVYAVVHKRFGKRAALKLAHGTNRNRRLTQKAFLREARVSNLIHHAGVSEVFATGTYDRRPYLAMEMLSGRSLTEFLDAPLPRDEALEILIELCDVLAAAHAAGVTHRDLKLDNVLLLDAPSPEGRRIKLLDWGMARIAGEHDPLRDLIAGTLTYVAPEQIRGEDITPAADLYALAVLTYRLLLGRAPFTSPNDLEILQQHLHDPPPTPRTLWREVPDQLEATLLAMLAKQPADRPALPAIVAVFRDALAQLRARALHPLGPPDPPVAAPPAPGTARTNSGALAVRSHRVAEETVFHTVSSHINFRGSLAALIRGLGLGPMPRVPLGLRGATLGLVLALTLVGLIQLLSA